MRKKKQQRQQRKKKQKLLSHTHTHMHAYTERKTLPEFVHTHTDAGDTNTHTHTCLFGSIGNYTINIFDCCSFICYLRLSACCCYCCCCLCCCYCCCTALHFTPFRFSWLFRLAQQAQAHTTLRKSPALHSVFCVVWLLVEYCTFLGRKGVVAWPCAPFRMLSPSTGRTRKTAQHF